MPHLSYHACAREATWATRLLGRAGCEAITSSFVFSDVVATWAAAFAVGLKGCDFSDSDANVVHHERVSRKRVVWCTPTMKKKLAYTRSHGQREKTNQNGDIRGQTYRQHI